MQVIISLCTMLHIRRPSKQLLGYCLFGIYQSLQHNNVVVLSLCMCVCSWNRRNSGKWTWNQTSLDSSTLTRLKSSNDHLRTLQLFYHDGPDHQLFWSLNHSTVSLFGQPVIMVLDFRLNDYSIKSTN